MASEQEVLSRYGRQMILPIIGRPGQERICSSRVLVVGAGGIGSTALLYLAASGISLTVVDHDTVDTSNLHRQVIHDSASQGMNKAVSAVNRLRSINPTCHFIACTERFTCQNALELVSSHDLVVDCTDNFEARYVINDACVLANKPYVTGSAVGLEGQLTVIVPRRTPCYRCLFPEPSLSESCRSCANAGVLGPVPGLIGCLQAIEVLKFLVSHSSPSDSSSSETQSLAGSQLFYDGLQSDFYKFELPAPSPDCAICSERAVITSLEDTQRFLDQCSQTANSCLAEYVGVLADHHHIPPAQLARLLQSPSSATAQLILDVRSTVQFGMLALTLPGLEAFPSLDAVHASLNNCANRSAQQKVLVNLPLQELQTLIEAKSEQKIVDLAARIGAPSVYLLCRRGVDSVVATRLLCEKLEGNDRQVSFFNVTGGLVAWHEEVDASLPLY